MWGFGLARQEPVVLWMPPVGMRQIAALLMLVSFILIVSADIPRNGIKARLHHPMTLGVMVWAVAHLLANGTLPDVILFGGFLFWALCGFRSARKRDWLALVSYSAGPVGGPFAAVVIGIVPWAFFAFLLHSLAVGGQRLPTPLA